MHLRAETNLIFRHAGGKRRKEDNFYQVFWNKTISDFQTFIMSDIQLFWWLTRLNFFGSCTKCSGFFVTQFCALYSIISQQEPYSYHLSNCQEHEIRLRDFSISHPFSLSYPSSPLSFLSIQTINHIIKNSQFCGKPLITRVILLSIRSYFWPFLYLCFL